MASEAAVSAGPAALSARRGEAFYRALVEGMNDGVLTRDAAGVITYASPRFRRHARLQRRGTGGRSRSSCCRPSSAVAGSAVSLPRRRARSASSTTWSARTGAGLRSPCRAGRCSTPRACSRVGGARQQHYRRAPREPAAAGGSGGDRAPRRRGVLSRRGTLPGAGAALQDRFHHRMRRLPDHARAHGRALDRLADNVEYDLADTACEETIKAGKVFYCASGVESRFAAARGLGVDSYLGLPLFGTEDHVIGHLAFVHDAPIDRQLLENPVVRIFASRARRSCAASAPTTRCSSSAGRWRRSPARSFSAR